MQETHVNSSAECHNAVKRMLASGVFQKSPKLKEFLAYTAEHSLKGERDLLSEQQIGIAVFGRTPGYNPSDDSIVRVQAHNLREKLAEYFDGEGAGEAVVITVPKGSYGLAFTPHPIAAENGSVAPAVSGMEGEPAPPANSLGQRRGWEIFAAGVLAFTAFTLGVAVRGFWVAQRERPENTSAAADTDKVVPNLILRSVFAPPTQTVVIFEDSLLIVASLMRGSAYSLNEFIAAEGATPNLAGAASDLGSQRVGQMLPTSRHLQLANVTFVIELLRFYPHLAESALFKHPREVQLREIKSSSCVLFGAQLSNPWAELYEPALNFHLRTASEGGGFENRRPGPGERGVYGGGPGGDGLTYARIALLPNFQPNTRVLMLTGTGSPETEAAAEFVLDPNFVSLVPPELRRHLRTVPEHLEILLSTSRVGRVAGSVRVAAWRVQ